MRMCFYFCSSSSSSLAEVSLLCMIYMAQTFNHIKYERNSREFVLKPFEHTEYRRKLFQCVWMDDSSDACE